MNINDENTKILRSLGLSEDRLIKYFFPFLLLKQLKSNFDKEKYFNLSDTRDQIIIESLAGSFKGTEIISNFDLNIIKDMLETKLGLIDEVKEFPIYKSQFKEPRGPKGKLYSVNKKGIEILDEKKDELKYLLELIIKFPIEDKNYES